MADKEKLLYLIQMRDLEEQVESWQLKRDAMERQNVASKCSLLQKDEKDSTEFLKNCMDAKEKMVDDLTEQLRSGAGLDEPENPHQHFVEAMKLQHSQKMKELQEWSDKLQTGTGMSEAAVDNQEEQNKQLLMQELSVTEYNIKRMANLIRMKTEAEELEESGEEETCSNVVEEEREDHKEKQLLWLPDLQREHSLLLKEVDIHRDKVSQLPLDSERQDKELIRIKKECVTAEKEVEQLMEKEQELKAKLKVKVDDYCAAMKSTQAKMEALKHTLASVSKEVLKKTAEACGLRARLEKECRRRQLEGVMQESAIILRHILTDPKKSATECMMVRLLEMVESVTPQDPCLQPLPFSVQAQTNTLTPDQKLQSENIQL